MHNHPNSDKDEQAVHRLMGKIEHVLAKKYSLMPIGNGGSMPSGVLKGLSFSFQMKGPLEKEKIREVLVKSGEDFYSMINADSSVKPYMEYYPFTIKNIDIDLFFIDQNGRGIREPYIGGAQLYNGKLEYWVLKNSEFPEIASESEETYEEALQALGRMPGANVNNAKAALTEVQLPAIKNLLPGLLIPFDITPAIPDKFIAMTPTGKLDLYDWIYWGPRQVLENYFKNPNSLNQPLIRVKLSANIAQTGPREFNRGNLQGIEVTNYQWGPYPVIASETTMFGKKAFVAWAGLNDPQSGWTLMFNLVYPEKQGHPDANDMAFWKHFLSQTK